MSAADDLYREIILEHFKNPRNHGTLAHPSLKAEGTNPFCGDELEVTVALEGERIADIRSQGKGCSISQASASMMTEAVKGKTLGQAEQMVKSFKGMMLENAPMAFTPDTEDLESLEGVKKYPVRIKCAILSWNTLWEGIEARRGGKSQSSHVEGEEGSRPDLTAQMASEPQAAAGVSASPEDQVKEALKTVIDPELNMNVVDLGLIYGIEIQGPKVTVTYTLTSPGCPLGPIIKGQMNTALLRLPWIKEADPQLVWSPPWDPHTMASDEVKLELGIW
ncbi:MAG: SUF system NifU family Fe-S cluster assembly protein [Candidatus Omnitrophica bacterium]|nr:SUF system NifU family Fe-S cluster assembly protein [Candidatus Omnitrophota bacterium]